MIVLGGSVLFSHLAIFENSKLMLVCVCEYFENEFL